MTTGTRIRRARQSKNLTRKQLAERLGVSASAIEQWESNRRTPDNETLTRLATELDIQPDALTGMTQVQTKDLCRVLLNAQKLCDAQLAGEQLTLTQSERNELVQASCRLAGAAEKLSLLIDNAYTPDTELSAELAQLSPKGLRKITELAKDYAAHPRYRRKDGGK